MEELQTLPTGALIALGAIVVLQLALQVYALVDVARKPQEQLSAPKWIWVVVILLGELIGAIVYLVIGRKPAQAQDTRAEKAAGDRAEQAADVLYGDMTGNDAGSETGPSQGGEGRG